MTDGRNAARALPERQAVPPAVSTQGRDLTGKPDVPALAGSPTSDVPPNSSPLRELAHAVDEALALPKAATELDELLYLRASRDRARLVREIMREIIRDRDIEHDPRDVMALVVRLRRDTRAMPDGWR